MLWRHSPPMLMQRDLATVWWPPAGGSDAGCVAPRPGGAVVVAHAALVPGGTWWVFNRCA